MVFNKTLIFCLFNSIAFISTAQGKKENLPNIVYILVDDLGYGSINIENSNLIQFNNPFIQTPQLAKLSHESLVFTDHYATSPVCSPSRAGLLTGRIPSRTNINLYIDDLKDNDVHFLHGSEITIPELLKTRGYQTAIFGKWHLNGADWENPENWTGWTGSFPNQQGFDYGIVTKEDPHFTRLLKVNTQKHPGDFFTVDGTPLGPIKGYTSDIIADSAIQFLKNRKNSDQPFFLYLPFDAVHIRIAAADKYEELYNTGDARRDAYYANITHLDDAVGRFLRILDELDLSENTILFFSSDNGPDVWRQWDAPYFCYGTSYPLMGHKYQLWEGGIRVPAMVRWKGKIAPGISNEPVSGLDILPTLCDLTEINLPVDRTYDGTSILGNILNNSSVIRDKPLYWQYDYALLYSETIGENYERIIDGLSRYNSTRRPRVSLRSGDFVLMGYSEARFTRPDHFELYNLKSDPEQLNDLSGTFNELTDSLKKSMFEIFDDVNRDRINTQNAISKKETSIIFN
jgi:arylsulfatase A